MTISQFLPWILPSMIITAIVTFPLCYMMAYFRTNPSHRHYVPQQKLVWKALTLGDIAAWIYIIIWVPAFLFICINVLYPTLYAYLSNPYSNREEIKIPVFLYVLIFTGPVGSDLVRIIINKKF